MSRAADGNAAAVEKLYGGVEYLTVSLENRKVQLRPVSGYSNGRDFQHPVAGKRNRPGLFQFQPDTVLPQQAITGVAKHGFELLGKILKTRVYIRRILGGENCFY